MYNKIAMRTVNVKMATVYNFFSSLDIMDCMNTMVFLYAVWAVADLAMYYMYVYILCS